MRLGFITAGSESKKLVSWKLNIKKYDAMVVLWKGNHTLQ